MGAYLGVGLIEGMELNRGLMVLATVSRLYTLYGLETLHVKSSRHVEIPQNVLRHIRRF